MKHIAIIVGIKTDAISVENFPNWLSDIPDKLFNLSKERWGKGEYGLSSDIGIAYYLLKKSNTPTYKNRFTVTILTKNDISLKLIPFSGKGSARKAAKYQKKICKIKGIFLKISTYHSATLAIK